MIYASNQLVVALQSLYLPLEMVTAKQLVENGKHDNDQEGRYLHSLARFRDLWYLALLGHHEFHLLGRYQERVQILLLDYAAHGNLSVLLEFEDQVHLLTVKIEREEACSFEDVADVGVKQLQIPRDILDFGLGCLVY